MRARQVYISSNVEILTFIFQNANLKAGITLHYVTNERVAVCVSLQLHKAFGFKERVRL